MKRCHPNGLPRARRCFTPLPRRFWARRRTLVLLSASVVLPGSLVLLMGILLIEAGTAWAQIHQAPTPACRGQSCDNSDPYGRCTTVEAQGGCLAPSDFRDSPGLPATPTSCAIATTDTHIVTDRFFGVSNPGSLEITTDGTSKGVVLAKVALLYSATCQTNWLIVMALGSCVSPTLTPICTAQGSLSRPASNDGPARSVFLIDPHLRPLDLTPQDTAPGPNLNAPVSNRSAMLYAPHAPVQGCVRISVAGVTSPLSCLTQPGFPASQGAAIVVTSPHGKEEII